MTLAEIKPMHGESLYDRDGKLVGIWYGERGMLADCYIVRENTCRLEDKMWSGLGRRTEWGVVCSNCNAHIEQAVKRSFRFCPNCGAKAVDE